MIKIGVTGPESTGKTVLSKELSEHYQAQLIEEYARAYLKSKKDYNQQDLDVIAQQQWDGIQQENFSNNLMIIDTEMTVVKVWSTFKYKATSSLIEKLYKEQELDLYLLCDIDIPWEHDPLREHPEYRQMLFDMYEELLEQSKRPYIIISGDFASRKRKAVEAIDQLMNS